MEVKNIKGPLENNPVIFPWNITRLPRKDRAYALSGVIHRLSVVTGLVLFRHLQPKQTNDLGLENKYLKSCFCLLHVSINSEINCGQQLIKLLIR